MTAIATADAAKNASQPTNAKDSVQESATENAETPISTVKNAKTTSVTENAKAPAKTHPSVQDSAMVFVSGHVMGLPGISSPVMT